MGINVVIEMAIGRRIGHGSLLPPPPLGCPGPRHTGDQRSALDGRLRKSARLAEHDVVSFAEAAGKQVRLLPVVQALADRHLTVAVDLARVVERATLAVVVASVIDTDYLVGPDINDRRAGGAVDRLALGRVADGTLPDPPGLTQPVNRRLSSAAVD